MKNALLYSGVLNVVLLVALLFGLSNSEDLTVKPEISEVTAAVVYTNLPTDIDAGQISRVYDGHYAVVVKPSFNIDLSSRIPNGFAANFSGILQWDEAENRWEKFLSVTDTDRNISSANNPLDLTWVGYMDTDQVPHLTVVDTNGAGSGEGLAKVLVPESIDLQTWKVVDCFDYAYDLGRGKTRSLGSKECQAVKVAGVDAAN